MTISQTLNSIRDPFNKLPSTSCEVASSWRFQAGQDRWTDLLDDWSPPSPLINKNISYPGGIYNYSIPHTNISRFYEERGSLDAADNTDNYFDTRRQRQKYNTMASTLPDVTTLSSLPGSAIITVLDLLFEPSEDLHTLALPTLRSITFASYPELIATIREQLLAIADNVNSDPEACQPLLSVLGSHPRLGAKKVDSAQSVAEQAQLNNGPEGEAERLAALNKEYEEKFPGLRYVVFVNGRSRDVIMEDMRRRIDRANFLAEEKEAINVSVKRRTAG